MRACAAGRRPPQLAAVAEAHGHRLIASADPQTQRQTALLPARRRRQSYPPPPDCSPDPPPPLLRRWRRARRVSARGDDSPDPIAFLQLHGAGRAQELATAAAAAAGGRGRSRSHQAPPRVRSRLALQEGEGAARGAAASALTRGLAGSRASLACSQDCDSLGSSLVAVFSGGEATEQLMREAARAQQVGSPAD